MIKSVPSYSLMMKRLQIGVIILAGAVAIYKMATLEAHVDIHLHRSEEIESLEKRVQEKKDQDAFQRTQRGEGRKGDSKKSERYIAEQLS